MMEIRRDLYLNKLIKRKNNGLIKVVTGIRRCGKSYLLNNLFYNHLIESGVAADHIIRFAFDSADDLYLIGESLIQIEKEKRGVDPEKFMAYIRSQIVDNGMYYLLLDEIQLLDCFETVLNGYLRKDNMDGVIVVESLEEEVWPERIASFTKYKEKTYGITRISYYQKEENE